MTLEQVNAIEQMVTAIKEVQHTGLMLGQKFQQDDEPREIKQIILGTCDYLERTGMSDEQIERVMKRVQL